MVENVVKSLRDYMDENERKSHVRIKTIVPLGDEEMEYIERALQKYVPLDITPPVKTIMQKHPLDFQDITNAEVWIVDVESRLPISAYVLKQELKLALNIPEKYIVVRSANDPLEIESQRIVSDEEISMAAMEDGLTPAARLSTKSSYDEDELSKSGDEPLFGNEYNKSFLETLAKIAAERKIHPAKAATEDLNQGGTVKDQPGVVPTNDFNANIDGIKPVDYNNYAETLKNLRKTGKIKNSSRLSTKGNYDDDEISRTKKYEKYDGNQKVQVVTIKNEREGIRKNDGK